MRKILLVVFVFLMMFGQVDKVSASEISFVTIVNPVRGQDFWNNNFDVWEMPNKQIELLIQLKLQATFLLRPDVYLDTNTLEKAKKIPDKFEKGLFLEITPTWANRAGVSYHQNGNWHAAESVFLTGYTQSERVKLIDSAFVEFKDNFGFYPKSVGAWWVDSYSISYMYEKYHIQSVLIVADQYSTDNYQVWGQYFGYPYYPSKTNALFPAQEIDSKIPVVMMQWAPRDPVNGYGKGVEESTLSVQANDYIDYHDLDVSYFRGILKAYLNQPQNKVNQVVIGMENSYSSDKYFDEYSKQISEVNSMRTKGEIQILDMASFGSEYKQMIPGVSPESVIVSDDPMGSSKKAVWYMNPYYRASWIWDGVGARFRDIRQYLSNQPEMCYDKSCQSINFATGAVRVLDQVTNGLSLELDEGAISNFQVKRFGQDYVLSYVNAANKSRTITFMSRDIMIDKKISTIDGIILQAQMSQKDTTKTSFEVKRVAIDYSNLTLSALKFLAFLLLAVLVPGLGIVHFLGMKRGLETVVVGFSIGLIGMVLFQYFIGRFWDGFLIIYLVFGTIAGLTVILKSKYSMSVSILSQNYKEILIVVLGSVFWCLPVLKSGLLTNYGLGFWGPNGHDGIWHLSVAESLLNSIPPVNPVFANTVLKNYHYLFDVLLTVIHQVTKIEMADLLFRFLPLTFSLLIGFGVWVFVRKTFNSRIVTILSLVFVYFTGSFGWIVEYLRGGTLSGESAFWVNQPISINLNPPFAFSMVILVTILIMYSNFVKTKSNRILVGMVVLGGSLIGIKIYGFMLLILAIGVIALLKIFQKQFKYLILFAGLVLFGIAIVVPTYDLDSFSSSVVTGTFIFSPWWFIHSMIDYSDRVGWLKLSQARSAYFERGEWFKFGLVELMGFVIFYVGNLGVRSLVVLSVFQLKNIWKSEVLKLVLLMVMVGSVIPLFFIQRGTAWNTVQFFYYVLPFMSIAVAWCLVDTLKRFPMVLKWGIIIVVFAIGVINTSERAISYFQGSPHSVVPFGELEALKTLQNEKYGVVLTVPYQKELKDRLETPWPLLAYDSTAYVSALSKKPVYVEDEMQNEILGNDYVKRRVASKDFFSSPNSLFLDKNQISYVYVPKIYKISIPNDELGLVQIFENNDVRIYKRVIK